MEIVVLWVYYTIPFSFDSACFGTFGSTFSTFGTTLFGEGSLMRVHYPKCAYGPYCLLNPIQNGVYILEEVSFYI